MAAIIRAPGIQTTSATRLLAVAVAASATLVALAATAGAQAYPPRAVISVANPGAVVTIESPNADWGPGTQVRISYETPGGAQVSRAATVDEDGTVTADVAIPENAEPGMSEITVTGVGADGQRRQWEPTVLVQKDSAVADRPSLDGAESPGGSEAPDQTRVAQAETPDPAAAAPQNGASSAEAKTTDNVTAQAGLPATGNPVGTWLLAAVLAIVLGSAAVMGAQVYRARHRGLDS